MHSPEPWISESTPSVLRNLTEFEAVIGNDPCGFSGETKRIANILKQADAERIVACVNACAGIPTEDLVAMAKRRLTGCSVWKNTNTEWEASNGDIEATGSSLWGAIASLSRKLGENE